MTEGVLIFAGLLLAVLALAGIAAEVYRLARSWWNRTKP